jgi:cell wall-associated NlpC family hydrolase
VLSTSGGDNGSPYFFDAPIDSTKTLFPLQNYSQSIDEWLLADPNSMNTPLLDSDRQQQFYSELKARYFGMGPKGVSPWNPIYIQTHLDSRTGQSYRDKKISEFVSQDSRCFGENFRLRELKWKNILKDNSQTNIDSEFRPEHRAITLRETLLRCLPTQSPAYSDPRQAGEGYPFDNLQDSSLKPATPIYILSESADGSWKYVISPHELGWIRTKDVARVDSAFINEWLTLAEAQLATVINAPVTLKEQSDYYFIALAGTFLLATTINNNHLRIAIPVTNAIGAAKIKYLKVSTEEFIAMPLEMTRANLACMLRALAGKPYGWGNYNFNNDCSAELQRLLIPFGILLPRNSSEQTLRRTALSILAKQPLRND